ncbi:MAG TPA: hypothetical protein VGR28_11335 [Candidatus Thermoplasmatota archaeon]|jgi:plastocyanin|nr:hypothetical protein [Candidatus Thermoplasmatota archaeon]
MLPALLAVALALPLAAPAMQADPGCLGGSACGVPSSGLAGFVPPVVIVASGGRVTWSSLDGPHVNEEGLTSAVPDTCLATVYDAAVADSAVFRLTEDGVTAEGSDSVERVCTSAVVVGGVGVVGYRCIIHPFTMRGVVVVLGA